MTTAGNKRPSASAVHPIDPLPPPATNHGVGNASVVCRRACAVFLFIVVLMAVALLFLSAYYFSLSTPTKPWWPHLQINSLSAAVNSSAAGQISGNWTAQITILNKDSETSAFYDPIDCKVMYKRELLAFTQLPSFELGPGSQMKVAVTLAASGLHVDDWVVGDIDADVSQGSVKFDLWCTAGVHAEAIVEEMYDEDMVDVYCEGFPMNVSWSSSAGGREMLSGVCHGCFKNCSMEPRWVE